MKYSDLKYSLPAVLTIAALAMACSKQPMQDPGFTYPVALAPSGAPVISAITPDSGVGTMLISIYGKNFGTDPAMDTIWFSGTASTGTLNIVTDTLITATVPAGVATGNIQLSVYGKKVTGPVFTYVPFVMNYVVGYSAPGVFAGTLGTITTTNGTPGTFRAPRGAAIDAEGNIYVGEMSDNVIREISPSGNMTTIGVISTGGDNNGPITTATFSAPRGVAVDQDGNLIVVETTGDRVRKVNFQTGQVSTIAGPGATGTGSSATFSAPQGVAVDSKGVIYVADGGTHTIKMIVLDASDNATVSVVAGTVGSAGHVDGMGTSARLYTPLGIAVDKSGNLIESDYGDDYIRYINTTTWAVTTLAGTGAVGNANSTNPLSATFASPAGIAVDLYGNILIADYATGDLRRIDAVTHAVTTIGSGLSDPVGVVADATGNVYTVGYGNKLVQKFTLSLF